LYRYVTTACEDATLGHSVQFKCREAAVSHPHIGLLIR
jgi:hypothetical protein